MAKKYAENSVFALMVFLAIVLLVLLELNIKIKSQLQSETFHNISSLPFTLHAYPFLPESTLTQPISASSAALLDSDTNIVLFAKDGTLSFPTASTAKIMTALVALDYYHMDDVLTVFTAPVEGSVMGLHVGEQLTFRDLLYGMLLPSGNDAALSIAQNYPGGESAFIAKMNEKVRVFHLLNTHFADPTGLDDGGDYTTAIELARLGAIAMRNPIFAKIVGTSDKTVTTSMYTYSLQNLNKLLGTSNIVGVKTGSTKEAGEVLVTAKEIVDPAPRFQRHTIIAVVMHSQDRFADTESLLSMLSGFSYLTFPFDTSTVMAQ